MSDATIELSDIQRLTLEPGDILVITIPHAVSQAAMVQIRDDFKRWFPDNKAIVLEEGARLQVVHETSGN